MAQKHIDAFNYKSDEVCIEEYDVDKNAEHLQQHQKMYYLEIHKNGNVENVRLSSVSEESLSSFYGSWMIVTCFATSEEHAIKIAGEKRRELLASNLWK